MRLAVVGVGLRCGHRPAGVARFRFGQASCPHSPRGTSLCRLTRPPRQDGAGRFGFQSSFGTRREREKRKAGLPVAIGARSSRLRAVLLVARLQPRPRDPAVAAEAAPTPSPDEAGHLQIAITVGTKALLLPPHPARLNRRLKTKAPCAVLAAGDGQRPWMAAVGELDRMSNRAGPVPCRQGGAHSVSRRQPPPNARAPSITPTPVSHTSSSGPANGRRAQRKARRKAGSVATAPVTPPWNWPHAARRCALPVAGGS